MTTAISPVGADLTRVYTSADFGLGIRAVDSTGGEFLFCSFAGTTTAKDVCSIDENYAAAATTTTLAAGEDGQPAGVCQATQTAASWGWVRVYGAETGINVATSAAANAAVNTTATAGRIDDDATTGAYLIDGLALTAAESSNTAPGFLNHPTIGIATLP